MIISKIYDSLNLKHKEALEVGLAGGLVSGLAGGLAFGLAVGLAVGLAFGLAGGLAFGIASPLWLFALAIFAIAEVLFFIGKEKPDKDVDKLVFTLRYKAEAIFEAALLVVNFANVVRIFQTYDVPAILAGWLPAIEAGLFYLGVGVTIVAGIACWVWLNSLKYERPKVGRPKKVR